MEVKRVFIVMVTQEVAHKLNEKIVNEESLSSDLEKFNEDIVNCYFAVSKIVLYEILNQKELSFGRNFLNSINKREYPEIDSLAKSFVGYILHCDEMMKRVENLIEEVDGDLKVSRMLEISNSLKFLLKTF